MVQRKSPVRPAKKLQPSSKFEQYDLDNDGTVTDQEVARHKDMLELELREEKADAQKRMAWVAIASMLLFTLALFMPFLATEKIKALGDVLGLFYIGQASIVGFYFGATAYMSK